MFYHTQNLINPIVADEQSSSGEMAFEISSTLVRECTVRLQQCRIYPMSASKTLRATVAFLIARDGAHEMACAKALPANDGTRLVTLAEPQKKYPISAAPERPEEFSPGLDPELQALADALQEARTKVRSNGDVTARRGGKSAK